MASAPWSPQRSFVSLNMESSCQLVAFLPPAVRLFGSRPRPLQKTLEDRQPHLRISRFSLYTLSHILFIPVKSSSMASASAFPSAAPSTLPGFLRLARSTMPGLMRVIL